MWNSKKSYNLIHRAFWIFLLSSISLISRLLEHLAVTASAYTCLNATTTKKNK